MTSSRPSKFAVRNYGICEVSCNALVADAGPTRKVNNGSRNGKRARYPGQTNHPILTTGRAECPHRQFGDHDTHPTIITNPYSDDEV